MNLTQSDVALLRMLGALLLAAVGAGCLLWGVSGDDPRARALAEARANVHTIEPDRVDPALEGQLVHVTGLATARSPLADPVLDCAFPVLQLRRDVQVYQWSQNVEESSRSGDASGTRCSYTGIWSPSLIDSSRFTQPAGHQNPTRLLLQPANLAADPVVIGAFRLPPGLITNLGGVDAVRAEPGAIRTVPGIPRPFRVHDGGLYASDDPDHPRIGDIRVLYYAVKPTLVSLIACQRGDSFTPYVTEGGVPIYLFRRGAASVSEMLDSGPLVMRLPSMVLRVLGLVMLLVSARLVRPRPPPGA